MKLWLAIVCLACTLSSALGAPRNSTVFNVRSEFGAVGDGRSDDTRAVQAAFLAAHTYPAGATLYFPGGRYLIASGTLATVNVTRGLTIAGEGAASTLLWARNQALFAFLHAADALVVRDLRISSVGEPNSKPWTLDFSAFALALDAQCSRCLVENLLIDQDDKRPDLFAGGAGIYLFAARQVSIVNVKFLGNSHGVNVGSGDDVKIMGCTFEAQRFGTSRPIGILLMGGLQGTHIASTLTRGFHSGVVVTQSPPKFPDSNVVVQIDQLRTEANNYGLAVTDSAIVTVDGIAALRNEFTGVWLAANGASDNRPQLTLSGGTLGFSPTCLKADVGTFAATGVQIRGCTNGVWVPSAAVAEWSVVGSRLTSNSQNFLVNGKDYLVTSNVLCHSVIEDTFWGTGFLVQNNQKCGAG